MISLSVHSSIRLERNGKVHITVLRCTTLHRLFKMTRSNVLWYFMPSTCILHLSNDGKEDMHLSDHCKEEMV